MSRLGYRLTHAADEDIATALKSTLQLFGPVQQTRYADLIELAIHMAVEKPARPGSLDRREIGAGIRSLHIELAARRRGAASHILYYRPDRMEDGSTGIAVLRLLHDGMDPQRHLIDGSN